MRTLSNAEIMESLAACLFEAYARNCGYNPNEHFDRNAAEQWMHAALVECGVVELYDAGHQLSLSEDNGGCCPHVHSAQAMERFDEALMFIDSLTATGAK